MSLTSDPHPLPVEVMAFLGQPACRVDPHPFYRRLLAESPIYGTGTGSSIFCRHADVTAVLTDPRFSIDIRRTGQESMAQSPVVSQCFMRMMSMRDAPDHERLRRLVRPFFSTRAVEGLRARVEAIVDDLLAPGLESGRLDVIADLARDLPVHVTCAMLGIPEPEWPLVQGWTESLTGQLMKFGQADDEVSKVERSLEEFVHYVKDLSAQRVALTPTGDLLGSLGAAVPAELDAMEHVALCLNMLISGRDTATHMIGNGILCLLQHPGELRRLREDPSLARAMLAEGLRFESPVRLAARIAMEDLDIAGAPVRRGEVAVVLIGAANRDPERFHDPDRFDPSRADQGHIAFGQGAHFCLGHAVARIEGEVVLDRFARRLRDVELAVHEPAWSDSLAFRGVESLPITFRAS